MRTAESWCHSDFWMLRRAVVGWRAWVVAGLCSVLLGVLACGGLSGRHAFTSGAAYGSDGSRVGLSALPVGAQAQVSRALGADSRAYRVSVVRGGFQAV